MRMPLPIYPRGRKPQDETRVPLKIMRPLKLRDYVSGRGDSSGQVACIQEMTVMMACFKANDFSQSPCAQEMAKFQNCVIESQKANREKEEMMKKGVTVGAKKLNHLQVNQFLRKYPS